MIIHAPGLFDSWIFFILPAYLAMDFQPLGLFGPELWIFSLSAYLVQMDFQPLGFFGSAMDFQPLCLSDMDFQPLGLAWYGFSCLKWIHRICFVLFCFVQLVLFCLKFSVYVLFMFNLRRKGQSNICPNFCDVWCFLLKVVSKGYSDLIRIFSLPAKLDMDFQPPG